MIALLTDISTKALLNIIQLIVGSLVSIPVYLVCRKYDKSGDKVVFPSGFPLMAIFSLCGMILPLDTYGVIPIFFALVAAGFRYFTVLPLIISNLLFNMLVPFNDPGFIWKTGTLRIIFAFFTGFAAGLLLRALKIAKEKILRENNECFPDKKTGNAKAIMNLIDKNIRKTCILILVGVIADTLFHRYALGNMINFISTNPLTASVPVFFSGYDVANLYFLITFLVTYTLIDLVKVSAMLLLLKLKGFVIFLAYFVALACLFAVSAFI